MTFLTPQFFCFFPVTALVFFLLPQRARNPWLLLASWFFYLWARPVYLSLLLFVIAASYLTGRLLAGRTAFLAQLSTPLCLAGALAIGLAIFIAGIGVDYVRSLIFRAGARAIGRLRTGRGRPVN